MPYNLLWSSQWTSAHNGKLGNPHKIKVFSHQANEYYDSHHTQFLFEAELLELMQSNGVNKLIHAA